MGKRSEAAKRSSLLSYKIQPLGNNSVDRSTLLVASHLRLSRNAVFFAGRLFRQLRLDIITILLTSNPLDYTVLQKKTFFQTRESKNPLSFISSRLTLNRMRVFKNAPCYQMYSDRDKLFLRYFKIMKIDQMHKNPSKKYASHFTKF